MATNWSTPKTTFFASLLDLRKALLYGYNAVLIKEYNEKCDYPIKVKKHYNDFRCYEFSVGLPITRTNILNDKNLSDFEKELSLKYKACYGTKEAMDTYYQSGKVSADNLRDMGHSHLVKVSDIVKFLEENGDERAERLKRQYITLEEAEANHFYDFFCLKKEFNAYAVKKFKKKLWVVNLLEEKGQTIPVSIKILNILFYPLKFIPKKSVLRMNEYTNYSFRIGSIRNGFEINFQIPKKFSFK